MSNILDDIYAVLFAADDSWHPVKAPGRVVHKRFPDYRGESYGNWEIVINGNLTNHAFTPIGGTVESSVAPFDAHVYFGDWLVGSFGPHSCSFVVGRDGRSAGDDLLESLKAATKGDNNNAS